MMFRVEGNLRMGKEKRPFSKEVEAESEHDALNKVFAEFGSKNGLLRSAIKVNKVTKVG
ncbi:MAG: 50S ribosomal protein L18Ae [Candidatus Bilamarchaeaceae archaeon]